VIVALRGRALQTKEMLMEDKISDLEENIENLRRELNDAKESRDRSNLEAWKWAEERNRVHKSLKESVSKIADLRAKLKVVDERVGFLKTSLHEDRQRHREKRAQLQSLNNKLEDLKVKRSYINSQELEDRIEEIDWKIQTTTLPLEQEKLLVEQVKFLETQLTIQRQVAKLRNEIESLREKMNATDKEIPELIEQRRELRQDMLNFSKKHSELRTEADEMHRKYEQYKDEARKFHLTYLEILNQIKALEQEISETEEERKTKRVQELESDLEKRALEKLKNREKLTFDEFKILAEKGRL